MTQVDQGTQKLDSKVFLKDTSAKKSEKHKSSHKITESNVSMKEEINDVEQEVNLSPW